jgi:hypothetical protein
MRGLARFLGVSRIATAAMFLLIPAAVHATPIAFKFSGTTTYIDGPDGGANVPGGTPFSGSFTYDSKLTVIDTSALFGGGNDPTTKSYGYFDPIQTGPAGTLAAKVDFGGLMSYDTTNAIMRSIVITNDPKSPPASLSVNAQNADGQWISIYLEDPTGQALNGTDLPTTLDLAKFGQTGVEYYDPNRGLVGGIITSLEPEAVPEPSTLAILALGGLGLVIARRKARVRGPIG